MLYHAILYLKLFSEANLQNLHKPYHVESNLHLAHFYRYIFSPPFLCIFEFYFLFLLNLSQAPHINSGFLKCISGINLSPANQDLLTIPFVLYLNYL